MKFGTVAFRGMLALALVSAGAGCGAEVDSPEATADDDLSAISTASIDAARASKDPGRMAKALRSIATNRFPGQRAARTTGAKRLLDGLSVDEVDAIRAAYIRSYDEDPEITIRSDGLFRPLVRLDRAEEAEQRAHARDHVE